MKDLIFSKIKSSEISEAFQFFLNGFGAIVLKYNDNSYEVIPVIGNEESYRLLECFDDVGDLKNFTTCSLTEVHQYLKQISKYR